MIGSQLYLSNSFWPSSSTPKSATCTTWDRLPQPVVEALRSLCFSLPQTMSLHVAVCFPTGRLILQGSHPQGQSLMHGVDAFPPTIFMFWNDSCKASSACWEMPSSHHLCWACSMPQTTSLPVVYAGTQAVCNVMMHGVEASPIHLLCLGRTTHI